MPQFKPGGILLFGGTFDPIHKGHLQICREAAKRLGAKGVILIPSASPPHKNNITISPIADRLAMARAAVGNDKLFEVSDCEAKRPGPSYTLDTVQYFRKQFGPNVPLYWLIGADMLTDITTWYKVSELIAACNIITAVRPGHDLGNWCPKNGVLNAAQIERLKKGILNTSMIDISATDIRNSAIIGNDITNMVPQPVADYIRENNLYRPK